MRNHLPETMVKAFEITGLGQKEVEERFGGLYRAFQYGAPPHGGMAAGIERMVMLLTGSKNVREVALFPMNQQAADLLMGAPSEAPAEAPARAFDPRHRRRRRRAEGRKRHAPRRAAAHFVRKATSFGMTWSGASSTSQWPEPVTMTPSTLSSTMRPWSIRNWPPAFSPDSTSIGMVSLVLANSAKSFASCSKARKTSKPARMAPGWCIGLRIELAVALGDRLLGVGGEIVPEVLEVDALAAVDQLERRLAVEVEVPEVAQQPDVRPVADAGQERVHQHDAVDLGGILRGVGVGDHQPDVVTGDAHMLVAERGGERVDVLRHGLLVVALLGLGGLAEAAQIGRDDGVGLGELRNQRQPHVAVLGVAVQQEDRLALPGDQVVELYAIDVGEAALDCGLARGKRGCGGHCRARDQRGTERQGHAHSPNHTALHGFKCIVDEGAPDPASQHHAKRCMSRKYRGMNGLGRHTLSSGGYASRATRLFISSGAPKCSK